MGSYPRGGALVLVGDDPAAKSSTLPCASDAALADLNIPYLYPADSQDVLDLGRHAIDLSRASGLWVGLKIVTAMADGSSTVDLAADWPAPRLPAGAGTHAPTARLLHPTLGQLERDLVTNRLRLAKEYARLNQLNRIAGRGPDDVLGVVAAGHTYLDVLAALGTLGIAGDSLESSWVRLLRVAMPWPLEEDTVREFADGLEEIVVVEEKRSFLEAAIRDVLYGGPAQPAVTGKADADGSELIPAYGELDADAITGPLRRRMTARGIPAAPEPERPAERMMLPLVSPPLASRVPDGRRGDAVDRHGAVPRPRPLHPEHRGRHVRPLGLAGHQGGGGRGGQHDLQAAVQPGRRHDRRPAPGQRHDRAPDRQPAAAEGVARVLVTTEDPGRYQHTKMPNGVAVWDRSRLDEAQRVLAATRGVTVLVDDQECATEKRRKRKRGKLAQPAARVFINERICEGCGDCGRTSNCLSVQPVPTEFGRKTRIHQSSCNVDYSCLDGDCPAFMTVVPRASGGGRAGGRGDRRGRAPGPEPVVTAGSFGIRLCGVGGTGVVTVSQVLATAGLIAGWHARSLDQTGLAQKGGAVLPRPGRRQPADHRPGP
jgi:indolepyruvate ferredoxin oxidoreductase